MGWFSLLKLLGPLALLAALAWGISDWQAKRREVAAEQRCERGAMRPGGDVSSCSPAVRAAVQAARGAQQCDVALGLPRDQGLFGVRAACSAPVKALEADDEAARASAADQAANAAQATSDRDAAIARAEARVGAFQDRVKADDKILRAAPHGADGSILCDAGCLRALSH